MGKTKQRKRKGGQPGHDAARKGQRPAKKRPTEPGEAWRHSEVLPNGNMRIRFEYITYSDASNELQTQAVANMFGAARNTDLATLAAQHPERVERGTLLTADGTFLAEAWINYDGDLLVLKGRPSTLEDLASHDVFNEPEAATEERKAEARRRIEEQAKAAAKPTIAVPDKRIVGPDGKPLT